MKTREIVFLGGLAVLGVLSGFSATRSSGEPATRPTQPAAGGEQKLALYRWLNFSIEQADQVAAADPGFAAEAGQMEKSLVADRDKLASMLDDPGTGNPELEAQFERVIASHNALERRVAKHVLAIRPYLTAAQQKQLMGLCAQSVREAGRGRPSWAGQGRSGGGGGPGGGSGGGGGGRRGGRWME